MIRQAFWGGLAAVALAGAGTPEPLTDALPSPTPAPSLPPMPRVAVGPHYFHEDFEHGMARWQATGAAGEVGWHHLRAAACGGRYTMVLGRPGNQPFAATAATALLTLTTPIDLTHARKPRLEYDLKGVSEPWDLFTVTAEARRPGGAWKPVGAAGTARYAIVATFTADLTPYAGHPVELRFRGVVKNVSRANRGFYLDDVIVLEPHVERSR